VGAQFLIHKKDILKINYDKVNTNTFSYVRYSKLGFAYSRNTNSNFDFSLNASKYFLSDGIKLSHQTINEIGLKLNYKF
jgi:hypothetical protein